MATVSHLKTGFILLAAGLLVAGCGGPRQNAMLEEAREAYATAQNDPQVLREAQLELKRAGDALRKAEELQREDAHEEDVTHHAYLAKQRVAVAQETAQLKGAQQAIEQAGAQRQEILLQARNREVEAARRQAEATQRQLESAQSQAQELESLRQRAERADELQARLSELEAMSSQQTARGIVLTMPGVLFDVDKAELKAGAERSLDQLAQVLQENPDRSILVEGFTDSTGPEEYNRKLSEERAAAVREALVQRGVNPERIEIRGHGEDYPVASNATPAGRQMNRRVEIVISTTDDSISRR